MNPLDLVKGQTSAIPASMAMAALGHRWDLARQSDFADDIEVLNFALLLEHLEAEFYRQGNRSVLLRGLEIIYLRQVEKDEAFHVQFLTDTIDSLGGTPVEAPEVDFGDAFQSRENYLKLSHTFENVGVGAYLGAAGFIQDKALLQAAAGIFGVEARHAAVVGNLLGLPAEGGVYMGPVETPIPKDEVLDAVGPFLPGS